MTPLDFAIFLDESLTGETLTPGEKLLLVVLTRQAGESGEVVPDYDALARLCFVLPGQIARNLQSLERKGLLISLPQRDNRGHKIPPVIQLFPRLRGFDIYPPSGLEAVKPERPNSPDANKSIRPRGLEADRRNRDNLSGAGGYTDGTEIATRARALPPSPSITSYGGTPQARDKSTAAVTIWKSIMEQSLGTDAANLILARVSPSPESLEAWRETLIEWKAIPRWRRDNVASQIERYAKKLQSGATTSPVPEIEASPEEVQERESARKTIYAEE